MTLAEYGKILDAVVPKEAGFICAIPGAIFLYKRKPSMVQLGTGWRWEGAGGQKPLAILRCDDWFLDYSEYKDEDGEIDWSCAIEEIK